MRRLETLAAGLAMGVLLCSCAAGGSGPTPLATVLSLESGLTAAEHAALVYTSLPACSAAGPALCAVPATVLAIKAADTKAYNLVTAAQTAVDADPKAAQTATQTAVSDATTALAALQAITPPAPPAAT
jgi:hypothetical protein